MECNEAKYDDDKLEVKDVGMVGGEAKDGDDERVVKNGGMVGDDEMGEMKETGDGKEDEVKDGLVEEGGDRLTRRVGVRDDMGGDEMRADRVNEDEKIGDREDMDEVKEDEMGSRKEEERDRAKRTGTYQEMGSELRRMGLKRNVNEMKLCERSTFIKTNNESLVESLVRRFEAMSSGDILGDMKGLDIKSVRFENTYESPGKRRRLCGDERPRTSPARPSRRQARQISATLLGGEAAAGRRGQVQQHGIGHVPTRLSYMCCSTGRLGWYPSRGEMGVTSTRPWLE